MTKMNELLEVVKNAPTDDLALLAFGEDKLREISLEKLQSWEGNDRELDYLLEAAKDTFNSNKDA